MKPTFSSTVRSRVEVEALLGESEARLARPAGQDASRVDP